MFQFGSQKNDIFNFQPTFYQKHQIRLITENKEVSVPFNFTPSYPPNTPVPSYTLNNKTLTVVLSEASNINHLPNVASKEKLNYQLTLDQPYIVPVGLLATDVQIPSRQHILNASNTTSYTHYAMTDVVFHTSHAIIHSDFRLYPTYSWPELAIVPRLKRSYHVKEVDSLIELPTPLYYRSYDVPFLDQFPLFFSFSEEIRTHSMVHIGIEDKMISFFEAMGIPQTNLIDHSIHNETDSTVYFCRSFHTTIYDSNVTKHYALFQHMRHVIAEKLDFDKEVPYKFCFVENEHIPDLAATIGKIGKYVGIKEWINIDPNGPLLDILKIFNSAKFVLITSQNLIPLIAFMQKDTVVCQIVGSNTNPNNFYFSALAGVAHIFSKDGKFDGMNKWNPDKDLLGQLIQSGVKKLKKAGFSM